MTEHSAETEESRATTSALSAAVKEAISRSEPIRAIALDRIRVESHGSAVRLEGMIASEAQKYLAERIARSVAGVSKVENELVTNEEVERGIASALASHEDTRHLHIVVKCVEGTASLYGAVATVAEGDAAVIVAERAVGPAQVRSCLSVVPPDEHVILLWQASLEGRPMVASPDPDVAAAPSEGQTGGTPAAEQPAAPVGEMA